MQRQGIKFNDKSTTKKVASRASEVVLAVDFTLFVLFAVAVLSFNSFVCSHLPVCSFACSESLAFMCSQQMEEHTVWTENGKSNTLNYLYSSMWIMICGFVMKYADILLIPCKIHGTSFTFYGCSFVDFFFFFHICSHPLADILIIVLRINFEMLEHRALHNFSIAMTYIIQYQIHNHYCRNSFYTPLIFQRFGCDFWVLCVFVCVCLVSHTLLHNTFAHFRACLRLYTFSRRRWDEKKREKKEKRGKNEKKKEEEDEDEENNTEESIHTNLCNKNRFDRMGERNREGKRMKNWANYGSSFRI